MSLGYETERLAGVNRIETAVKVATDAENSGGDPIYASPERVYLARAFGDGTAGFADSLGGGMLAGTQGVPLLLTATDSVSPETMGYLHGLATPPMVTIIGGTAAVSQAVQDELTSMGFDTDRIADVNRYGTANDIAAVSFSGTGGAVVALVDGIHPDSWVSGFAASAFTGSAVLLTNGSDLPVETGAALERIDEDTPGLTVLYCAPQVTEATCQAADDILNA